MSIFTKVTEAEARKMAKARVDEILHPQCEIRTFNFPEHLSDNKDLVPSILEYVRRGSANICLSAPCASGKTYMIVNKLTKAAHGIGRRVIMTSPLSMLNTQTFAAAIKAYPVSEVENGGISCEILSGSSRDTYAYATFTSCVYDSIHRLDSVLDDVELHRTILVIDESHLIPNSRSYRSRAISGVESFANRVIDAGGTVIFMTATPRMIRYKNFSALFECTKTDEDGQPISPCLMKSLVYARRVTNRGSNIEVIAAHVYEDFINNGMRSIILVQSKAKIRRLQHILTGLGLSVGVIRSDDKEYVINPATHEKEYRSKLYGELAEHATLIYKDVYLVTSVIEVGVSIEHVMNAKGEPEQPENVQMIYACLTTEQYDIDAMTQFLSRLRYPYKRAILFGKSIGRGAYGMITPESYFLRKCYQDAFERGTFFNCTDEPRAAVRTADGRREDDGLKKEYTPDGRINFFPDDEEIMLAAYHEYDLQAYHMMPDKACEFLQQIFGVPVKKEIWKPSKLIRSTNYRPEPVSKEVVAELKNAINDPAFRKAVADPQGITENPHIDKIKAMGGNDTLRFLSVFIRSNCFSHENEIKYAVAEVENPHFTIMDDKKREVDPEIVARHNGFRMLANSASPEKTLEHLTRAYRGDLKITLTTGEQQILSLISGTKSWQYFLDLMNSYSNTEDFNATAYDLKEMCLGFASMTEEEAFEYRLREQYAHFNVLYDSTHFGKNYILGIGKRYPSLAGREYYVIRNAGTGVLQFDFTDKEGNPLFPGGITNKTISQDTLRLMAKQMATLIRQNFEKGMMPRRYSAKQIRAMLFGAYCITKSSGKPLEEAFVVRNLRKRASCYGLPGYIFSYDDVGADDPQTMDDEHICDKITKIVHCDEKDIPKATSAIRRLMNQIAPTDADRRFGLTKYFTLALTENRNLPKEERLGAERDDIMDILKTSATVLSEILYQWTEDLMVLDFDIDRLYLKRHPKLAANE